MKVPTIRKLPSGNYFCQLRIDGQSISITESSYDQAYAKAVAYKSGLLRAKKEPVRITVGQAIDEYIDNRRNILSPATIKGYCQIRRTWLQELMDKRVDTLTLTAVQKEINREAAHLSGKSIRNAYALLRSALKGKTDIDFDDVTLPPKRTKKGDILSREEMGRLYAVIRDTSLEVPFLLALWLSLRRSEIIALTWDCIGHDSITVKSAVVLNDRNEYVEKTTKTDASQRTIKCPKYLIDKINALPRVSNRILNAQPNTYYDLLQKACKKANVPPVGIHDLRHINASVMAYVGISRKHSMERGGWSSSHVLEKTYEHVFDDERTEAAARVDAFFTDALKIENANKNANGIKKFRISKGFLNK